MNLQQANRLLCLVCSQRISENMGLEKRCIKSYFNFYYFYSDSWWSLFQMQPDIYPDLCVSSVCPDCSASIGRFASLFASVQEGFWFLSPSNMSRWLVDSCFMLTWGYNDPVEDKMSRIYSTFLEVREHLQQSNVESTQDESARRGRCHIQLHTCIYSMYTNKHTGTSSP